MFKFLPETQEIEWRTVKSSLFSRLSLTRTATMSALSNTDTIDDSSTIPISEITSVCKGLHTDVMTKARGINKALDPICCLSIIASSRTLDIQCASGPDRDSFYRSLQGILANTRVKFS